MRSVLPMNSQRNAVLVLPAGSGTGRCTQAHAPYVHAHRCHTSYSYRSSWKVLLGGCSFNSLFEILQLGEFLGQASCDYYCTGTCLSPFQPHMYYMCRQPYTYKCRSICFPTVGTPLPHALITEHNTGSCRCSLTRLRLRDHLHVATSRQLP